MTDTSGPLLPPRLEEGYSATYQRPNRFGDTASRFAAPALEAARGNLEASRGGVGAYFGNMALGALNLADAAARYGVGTFADLIPGLTANQEADLARELYAIPEAFMGASPARGANLLDDLIESAGPTTQQVLRAMPEYDPTQLNALAAGFSPGGQDRGVLEEFLANKIAGNRESLLPRLDRAGVDVTYNNAGRMQFNFENADADELLDVVDDLRRSNDITDQQAEGVTKIIQGLARPDDPDFVLGRFAQAHERVLGSTPDTLDDLLGLVRDRTYARDRAVRSLSEEMDSRPAVRLYNPNGQSAIVSPGVGQDELNKFRVTYYDDAGEATNHVVFDTREEALAEALNSNFVSRTAARGSDEVSFEQQPFDPNEWARNLPPVQRASQTGTGLTSPAFLRALEITQNRAPASQYLRTLIQNNPRIEQELRWSGAYQELENLGDEVLSLEDFQSLVGDRADLFEVSTIAARGRIGAPFATSGKALAAREADSAGTVNRRVESFISNNFESTPETLARIEAGEFGNDLGPIPSALINNPDNYVFFKGTEDYPAEFIVNRPDTIREYAFRELYLPTTDSFDDALRIQAERDYRGIVAAMSPEERADFSIRAEQALDAGELDDLIFFPNDTGYPEYIVPGLSNYRENVVRANSQVLATREALGGGINDMVGAFSRKHFDQFSDNLPVYHTRTGTLPFRRSEPDAVDAPSEGTAHFIAEAQSDAQQQIRNEADPYSVFDVTGGRDRLFNEIQRGADEAQTIIEDEIEPLAMQWQQMSSDLFNLRREREAAIDAGDQEAVSDLSSRIGDLEQERLDVNRQMTDVVDTHEKHPFAESLVRAVRRSLGERTTTNPDGSRSYVIDGNRITDSYDVERVADQYRASAENAVPNLPLTNSSTEWLDHALRRELLVAIEDGRDALVLTPGSLPRKYSSAPEGVAADFYDRAGPRRMQNILRRLYGKNDAPELDRVWIQTTQDGWLEAPAINITEDLIERVRERGLQNFRAGGEVKQGLGTLSREAKEMFRKDDEMMRSNMSKELQGGIGGFADRAKNMFADGGEVGMAPPQGSVAGRAQSGPAIDVYTGAEGDRLNEIRQRIIRDAGVDPVQIASEEGIDPNLMLNVIAQESGGRANARSDAGAYGYMQLMEGTARELGVDRTDPVQNLRGGARYLRQQIERFNDVPLALAAYNAGPNAVERYGGIPPYSETRAYVANILGLPGGQQAVVPPRRPEPVMPVPRPAVGETAPVANPLTQLGSELMMAPAQQVAQARIDEITQNLTVPSRPSGLQGIGNLMQNMP